MKVAVFGAGTMGSGIAQVFAAKGHTALMYASSVASGISGNAPSSANNSPNSAFSSAEIAGEKTVGL